MLRSNIIQNLLKAFATVSLFTIGSRITGFIRTLLMAHYLGASAISDALIFAIKIPSTLRRIFAEGAFNAVFVPIFSGMLVNNEKVRARNYAENVLSILVLILSVLTIIVEIFMPNILPVIVPGFAKTPMRMLYAIEFCRLTFPFIIFISVCALFSGILNSLEKFAFAASSSMIGNLSIILTFFIVKSWVSNYGYAFVCGILVCGIAQSLWVLLPVLRAGIKISMFKPRITEDIKKFFSLILPVIAGAGVVQINIFIDIIICSFLPLGGISYLEYADRLNQLPLSTIGIAIGTALLPLLSKQLRKKQYSEARRIYSIASEFALLFTLPAAIALIFLAVPIISTIYPKGKISFYDMQQIAATLRAFAIGLPAFAMIKVLNSVYFANQDTKTPIYIAILSITLNILLNIILMKFWQHVGIALATTISSWVSLIFLVYYLQVKVNFYWEKSFKFFLIKMFFANAILALCIIVSRQLLWSQEYFLLQRIIYLSGFILGNSTIYFLICKYLKVISIKNIKITQVKGN